MMQMGLGMGGFPLKLGWCTAIRAEMLAFHVDLQEACYRDYHCIVLGLDSMIRVWCLQTRWCNSVTIKAHNGQLMDMLLREGFGNLGMLWLGE